MPRGFAIPFKLLDLAGMVPGRFPPGTAAGTLGAVVREGEATDLRASEPFVKFFTKCEMQGDRWVARGRLPGTTVGTLSGFADRKHWQYH